MEMFSFICDSYLSGSWYQNHPTSYAMTTATLLRRDSMLYVLCDKEQRLEESAVFDAISRW